MTLKLKAREGGVVLAQLPSALAQPSTPARPGVGACLWDGALALIDYLASNPPTRTDGGAPSSPPPPPPPPPAAPYAGTTVLELGAGVGGVGCALAALGAAVALTDLPAAVRLAAGNIARNWLAPGRCRPGFPSQPGCAVAAPLEWGGPAWRAQAAAAVSAVTAAAGLKSGSQGVDLVVASDVAYPAPPGGVEPDPVAWAEAAAEALGGSGGLVVFSFEARGGDAVADRLRAGLLEAATGVLGSKPVRVGVPGSAWQADGVEVWRVEAGGGRR